MSEITNNLSINNLNNNNNKKNSTQSDSKEKSVEKYITKQPLATIINNQTNLINNSSSLIENNSSELPTKKRTYEPSNNSRALNNNTSNSTTTNSVTFTKSNTSPTKHPSSTNALNTTIEDIEMLSSSPSSTSSLKEAMKQRRTMTASSVDSSSRRPNNSNNFLAAADLTMSSTSAQTTTSSVSAVSSSKQNEIELSAEPGGDDNENGNGGEEPSKLSISEKMKLFSGPQRPKSSAGGAGNVSNVLSGTSSTNSAKLGRFQTQPISSVDLDYANKLNSNSTTNNYNNNNNNNLNAKLLNSIENNNNIHASKITTTTPNKPLFDNTNKQSNLIESSSTPENNAISSKTITFLKKQQFDSILNDNQINFETAFYNNKNTFTEFDLKRKAFTNISSTHYETSRFGKSPSTINQQQHLFIASNTGNKKSATTSTTKPKSQQPTSTNLQSSASFKLTNTQPQQQQQQQQQKLQQHCHKLFEFIQKQTNSTTTLFNQLNCPSLNNYLISGDSSGVKVQAKAKMSSAAPEQPQQDLLESNVSSNKVDQQQQQQQQREPKRYKFKSKTDFIGKVSGGGGGIGGDNTQTQADEDEEDEANENSKPVSEPTTVAALEIGMTIQERMAALKKIGEDDWKRRQGQQPPAPINNESTQSNIVKQQKEQIQLQLKQMLTTTKTKMLNNSNTSERQTRNVLSTLDDNNNQHDNIDLNKDSLNDHDLFVNKKALIEKRVIFGPPDSVAHSAAFRLGKPTLPPITTATTTPQSSNTTKKQHNRVLKHSASSDTDTMFTRNASLIGAGGGTSVPQTMLKNERIELFSTDSEMDSFFKENETILNSQNLASSSSTTTNTNNTRGAETRTDDNNTMNEDFDDVEFDRIVSEANRLTQRTRAKPSRKAKSKGNHLKNLQNRIEIKNEYEQSRVPTQTAGTTKSSVSPSKSHTLTTSVFNN